MKFEIHRFATCVSTNDMAKVRAREDAPEGTVIVAEEQTGGRGTKGRSWFSPPGLGLYVSVILRPSTDVALSLLPLAAGLSAREAIERTAGLAVRLRWPNDIVWERKKLGGVLGESGFSGSALKYVIVGLGLNLNHAEDDFPDDLNGRATSLRLASGRSVDREALRDAFLEAFAEWSARCGRNPASEIIAAFLSHSETHPGGDMTIETAEGRLFGRFLGLDSDGALRLAMPSGERRFLSAEVTAVGPDLP